MERTFCHYCITIWVILMNLYKYRKCDHSTFRKYSIIETYHDLLEGKIKVLPRGTWQKDKLVIILLRYVLEVNLALSKEEIPKITRGDISKYKLWGAIN